MIFPQEQELDPYAGVPPDTVELLKFQDSAHIKLALKVSSYTKQVYTYQLVTMVTYRY